MTKQQAYENIFFARQPIFDGKLSVWGYQILYRNSANAQSAVITDGFEATRKVMQSIYLTPVAGNGQTNLVLTFPEESILINAPLAMPAANTVVLVDDDVDIQSYLLGSLLSLKQEGYRILVEFRGAPEREPLYRIADILALDCNGLQPEDLGQLVAEAEAYEVPILARRIEHHEEYELVKFLGCKLFQGYFFKRPNVLTTRQPTASEAAKLRLFSAIKGETANYDAVIEIIEADASISYRLLALLNAPSFGFVTKISTIRQAVLLLGWKQIKHWLRLVILSDIISPDKAFELAFLAAQRARFLELCGKSSSRREDPETLFLIGLFSLLEAMMDMPMATLLQYIYLDKEVKAALLGQGGVYAPWLELLTCIEDAQWACLESLLPELGLTPGQVEDNHQLAIAWANDFFNVVR